jgi:hypothetical protein
MGVSCDAIRPANDTGRIVDASKNVSAGLYWPGGSSPSVPIFIRHFYYVSGSSGWSIVSTGASGQKSKFEEAGVYALSGSGGASDPIVTRLARIPGVALGGLSPARLHLAIAAPGPLGNSNTTAIVYMEDGPIYSGLDVGVDLTGDERTIDMPLRLLVNARVSTAALSGDGVTVAYTDDTGRLYIKDEDREPEMILNMRDFLGTVNVVRMRWESRLGGRLLLVMDRGFGLEVRRLERQTQARLVPTFSDPETVRIPGADGLADIDRITADMGADIWNVPDPTRFGDL